MTAQTVPSVMVAMSGGVDSSVCGFLLTQAGYRCVGATMKLHDEAQGFTADPSCCTSDDIADAKAVCERLGIPHHVFNFRGTFDEAVINHFCQEYLDGHTPNPCVDCNRYLKFAALQRKRQEFGLDYVATGHYARRRFNEQTGRWQLLRALDPAKDQSYVLFHITQQDLASMLFPLGELTKEEVRTLAQDQAMAVAEKPESQDICFVPDGDYARFIQQRLGDQAASAYEPGPICTRDGTQRGTHQGLIHYTIGQRKGIGVAYAEPLYVYDKDPATKTLWVAPKAELRAQGVIVRDVNLIEGSLPSSPFHGQVKTHYRQEPQEATIYQEEDDTLRILFAQPQTRSAAGQAAVIYDGEVVLGGGTIAGVISTDPS